MYGKIFESMYDGSIADNWKALVTFQQMIVLCDQNGVIDMTHGALSMRAGIPIEIIREGIAELEKTDSESRSPDENGCRIVRLDDHRTWGWRLVNYSYYRSLATRLEKQEADRKRIAAKRKVAKHQETSECRKVSQNVANVAHTDTDTDTDTDKEKTSCSNSVATEISEYFFKAILAWKSNFKKPTKSQLKNWTVEIDRMIRLDNRTLDQIKAVIDFVTLDDFWRPNILSAKSLRAKFDQLEAKMHREDKYL